MFTNAGMNQFKDLFLETKGRIHQDSQQPKIPSCIGKTQ